MITPDYARRLLLELTAGCPVPAAPGWLSRYAFQTSDYVVVGDATVRGYKYKNRWRLDEREVRAAAERLASLPIDLNDLVNARIPVHGDGPSWRSLIRRWLDHAVYKHQAEHGCACPGQHPCDGTRPNRDGLGCAMSRAEAEARFGRQTIAATRPLPLMVWSGTTWAVPRAYAALLDRADALSTQTAVRSSACSRCGATGDTSRASSTAGYITLCAACTVNVARPYQGHLRGRLYASLPSYARADGFLCRMCPDARPAMYWDHCHTHGYVRGPVCASCNTYEGGGGRFLNQPGAVEHLLQCEGCHRERTVPARHQPDIVQRTFVFAPHDGCPHPPRHAFGTVEPDGSVRYRLSCWRHTTEHRWEQTVPAAHVRRLVEDFVDAAVAADGNGEQSR
ncbi:endonuclease domain-containing protein [Streptomyces anthocyanicus]|uniref:endonuclease domain-containing protein n=1 Tax=Streptomyces TaxID=1883 RepID=UPI0036478101